ncbi:Putative cytosolic protein (plasmid) [Borrelia coriaceae ATCC 43381]|uniref:Putative cytosolic protein n=1 Tax=Borrelia coriaceae ATCC 43381 TaxID=1408429 RepID=W5SWJ3_9SPIR|nr:Putative cytosolic protein [Borrelia coriaceae ATCC 43381]
MFNDLFTFGNSQREKGKFFISLRGLFDNNNKNTFHLFKVKDNSDKFLGMFYGFKRIKNTILIRYKDDEKQSNETATIYKPYYIEFRFKKGSIFCYIKAIHALVKKEKFNKTYVQSLLKRIVNLEHEVYKFYEKQLPDGGIITKWIEKNQK